MATPSRHHTVPQFYLRRWVPREAKRLWVLDKTDGRVFAASPRDVALEREFYTDNSGGKEMEYRLGRLEQRVAPIFKQIIQARSTADLSGGQWVDLFLAVQLERTQGGRIRRGQLFRAATHFTEALKQRGVDTSRRWASGRD